MTTKELYTEGARVWVPSAATVWEGAEVLSDWDGAALLTVRLDASGETRQLKVASADDLPPLRNPSILIGENDLTSLSYLHEPAVLHNLKVRFCDLNAIYTYCGIVLVAINPYDELPIYGEETILAYRGQAMGDLDPHIFAVAEEAYTKLEREHKDQSIIVSGESGAGKTVSAKYAMRYFATVGGSSSETQVERKVLASSPIMEAIGNAKTTRNDNSSRFGKFIEIHLSRNFHIVGASMRTYLLEKSRVVFQARGERNYHIFYQICAAREQLPHLLLDHQDTFRFLNQGEDPLIDGVDDLKAFKDTKDALVTLGFSEKEQRDMFVVLAAILHLGNITISPGPVEEGGNDTSGDTSQIQADDRHLFAFCQLTGISPVLLSQRLTHRSLVSRSETIESPLSAGAARGARDALAKHLYANLFSWLVEGANRALRCEQPTQHRIGVLDIYGFETFEVNSFEQFCINYANEKLQQQFNSHVFKLEQEEYLREDITWTMIHFYDNQPCIELIEARLGVLDLLDEECRVPQGSDASWAAKLHRGCAASKHFVSPRFHTEAFVIKHFADDVMYMAAGFLDKNRDTVLEEQVQLARASSCGLLVTLCEPVRESQLKVPGPVPSVRVKISPIMASSAPSSMSKQHKLTVGAQFRSSLQALMTSLNSTTPHYVRCIKPNDDKRPFGYDPARAVQQLRACGVLETIRISAAGFPSRWLYSEFFLRYRVLCHSKAINRHDYRATCSNIIHNCIKDEDKYRFGKTKIFFRAGQVAYLEKLRAEHLRRCCIIMQSQLRAFVARKSYLRLRAAVCGLQRYARGYLARRLAQELRRKRAAIVIQATVRGWLERVRYQRLRRTALGLQARCRGVLARRAYQRMRRNKAAIIIQKTVRGWLARRRYAKMRQQVIICQAAVRRFLARRKFRKLKAEARSVEHVKQLNKGLENKIISLQQRLGDLQQDNKQIVHLQKDVEDLRAKLEPLKSLEALVKELKATVRERDNRILAMDEQLALERGNNIELIEEKQRMSKEYAEHRSKWEVEKVEAEREMARLTQDTVTTHKDSEQKMRSQYELEKRELLSELDQEKTAYQKLLTDQYRLTGRLEEIQAKQSGQKSHQRSLSNASSASQQEEDNGYGSVRSVNSGATRSALDNIEWSKSQDIHVPSKEDAGLVLRLQARTQRVSEERDKLRARIAGLEGAGALKTGAVPGSAEDQHRITELEIENTRLLADLTRLRNSVARDGDVSSRELAEQFSALQEELERRREECIQLRSVLANQTVNLKSLATSNYGSDVDVINEDGELVQAFEAQKRITKQLEEELLVERQRHGDTVTELAAECERLCEDNERQHKMLTSGGAGGDQFMQQEVSRLAVHNLLLQERLEALRERCDALEERCEGYRRRLQGLNLTLEDGNDATTKDTSSMIVSKDRDTSLLPEVKKKDREFMGMFEYKAGTESTIVQRLVSELSPRTAVTLLPGLPAYVLFMCIRYTDYVNDDDKVRVLLRVFINGVKKVVKRKGDKMDVSIMWLANTLRLLHCLKQYSGDRNYQAENTPAQNEQCLRNFDLSEYRQVLSDIAVWIYQGLITSLEQQLQQLIVPALLEFEEISGVSGRAPRGRAPSQDGPPPPTPLPPRSPQHLTKELANIRSSLYYHGVDPDLIVQIFRQLYYFVCASCLNQLLLRKDLCRWSKGMQIRYNLSSLEVWAKEQLPAEAASVLATLQPIIQAVYLMQARKSAADVQSTCDMCPDLTSMQICKILNLYTPAEEFEPKITQDFIRQIQTCLQARDKERAHSDHMNLLMDSKFNFPVKFPFSPSTIRLEHVELAEALNLASLLTKL